MSLENLEERKLREIEHSRTRRNILKGFERIADTNDRNKNVDIESLISDKAEFEYHFSNMKFYSITKDSESFKEHWLRKHCRKDVKIIDFACGSGENGIAAAQYGATCEGIDISPEGVRNANENAARLGLAERASFAVMDGENMTFQDNTFDLGIEYGALHHVDLDKTLQELARVLKPGARMLCIEAMRHNPLIHLYRKRTPHLRTEWEVDHILGVESLKTMEKYFKSVDVRFFHLMSLFAVPFRKTFLFNPLLKFLSQIDRILLRSKTVGKYGWIMIIEIANPVKR